jgi:hypothetical protein
MIVRDRHCPRAERRRVQPHLVHSVLCDPDEEFSVWTLI